MAGDEDREATDRVEHLLTLAETAGHDVDAIESIIDQLSKVVGPNPDAEGTYALAYAWYLHPERKESTSIQGRVTALLEKVLESRSDDYLSLLYLGHNNYDIGEYGVAEEYFRRASAVAPATYVGLKSCEMLLCCVVVRRGVGQAMAELEQFVGFAEKCAKEDIWPKELERVLVRAKIEALDRSESSRLKDLMVRLDRAGGFKSWFQGLVDRDPM